MIFDPATFLGMGVLSVPVALALLAVRDLTRKLWP